MTNFAQDLWCRAKTSLDTAKQIAETDPDSSASRAYYAPFQAISALFALRDQSFTRHSQLRAAVHRDLVHPGDWAQELGSAYDELWNLRQTGDYGDIYHVSFGDAENAVKYASMILDAVQTSSDGQLV